MEEKKYSKISLSTVLLIIILCIYILKLSSKIDTLLEKENSISKWKWYFRIRLETTISSNTDTLPQLPGDFFDIKSIIKEYRDNQNVKNYKDFKYDLDSVGIMDKITLKHIINENEESYFSNREYYVID